mmetsp:Transcript_45934/g.100076  ORF Transcript_45934/g.100076 Transcript_45934/m.100076 type:complete len:207 (-) Transcript_45934:76-696(-)
MIHSVLQLIEVFLVHLFVHKDIGIVVRAVTNPEEVWSLRTTWTFVLIIRVVLRGTSNAVAVGTTSTKGFENCEANTQTDAAEDTMDEGKEQKHDPKQCHSGNGHPPHQANILSVFVPCFIFWSIQCLQPLPRNSITKQIEGPLANPAVVDGWQHLIFQPPDSHLQVLRHVAPFHALRLLGFEFPGPTRTEQDLGAEACPPTPEVEP